MIKSPMGWAPVRHDFSMINDKLTRNKTAIQLRSISKVFGTSSARTTALDDISLNIADNEFFTLLGPSGCGKTTLLRLIAGFEHPTNGQIILFDQPIANLPPKDRPVNMVFQHYALFPHMTVARNIAFGLEMLGKPAAEIEKITADTLAFVQMEAFANRKPDQLSGGQQQRIALARALAPHPKALLLDEPLSALDLKLRQQMRLELKLLQEQAGITFIFVTHDQEEALTMSDRIAVMSEGKVQQVGNPKEIYENPANHFVANFIGDANLFEAKITSLENGKATCQLPGKLSLQCAISEKHSVGEQVTIVVRPEKIMLNHSADATRGLTGRVGNVAYLGTDTAYLIELPNGLSVRSRVQNNSVSQSDFAAGDTVGVEFNPNSLHVLAG